MSSRASSLESERGIACACLLDVTATSIRGLDLSGSFEDGGFIER